MYSSHACATQSFAQSSPRALVEVIALVLCSIRQPWDRCGLQMAEIRERKAEAKALWGNKRAGYLYAVEHQRGLHRALLRARETGDALPFYREVFKVPGLGLAKAGFVLQLALGVGGCMDSHNVRRFGIDPAFLKHQNPLRDEAKQLARTDDRLRAYLALCEACGGCESLWDSWCAVMAAEYPKKFRDAEHVSRLHCDFLGLNVP